MSAYHESALHAAAAHFFLSHRQGPTFSSMFTSTATSPLNFRLPLGLFGGPDTQLNDALLLTALHRGGGVGGGGVGEGRLHHGDGAGLPVAGHLSRNLSSLHWTQSNEVMCAQRLLHERLSTAGGETAIRYPGAYTWTATAGMNTGVDDFRGHRYPGKSQSLCCIAIL